MHESPHLDPVIAQAYRRFVEIYQVDMNDPQIQPTASLSRGFFAHGYAEAHRAGIAQQQEDAWRPMLIEPMPGRWCLGRWNPSGWREAWDARSGRWGPFSVDLVTRDQALEQMRRLGSAPAAVDVREPVVPA
jgi:hypothetical protein